MATKAPSRDMVIGLGRRLASLYEMDELGHLSEGEFVAALRQLHVEARKAGIDLGDPEHPVATVIEQVADYDYDHASELLVNIQQMELADRRQVAEATAAVERHRFQEAAGEITHRSIEGDELASGIFRNLSAVTPAGDSVEENVENVREMARVAKSTSTTIAHADIRASIMDGLKPSQSPFGQTHAARRQEAIQEHVVATAPWEEDLESAQAPQTHAEIEADHDRLRAGIMAHSQGPVAAREWRMANGVDPGDGKDV